MKVTVAKTAGFCFGVERAVKKAEEMLASNGTCFSYGPVVHNETVTEELAAKGLSVVNDLSEVEPSGTEKILIRAHGVPKDVFDRMNETFSEVIDATCPFVKKIHRLVEEASKRGEPVVIIGDPNHPEVIGICGWCCGPYFVVSNEADVELIPFSKKKPLFVVVQTTFQQKKLKNLLDILNNIGYNATIADTVCFATKERQEEARELARTHDVMLVIGSASSSNSQKLYEICKENCSHTYFIQKVADIQSVWFEDVNSVGITAGASTPKKIIEEVQNYVRV